MKTKLKKEALFILLLLLIACSPQPKKPVVSRHEARVTTSLKTGEKVRAFAVAHLIARKDFDELQFQKTFEKVTESVLKNYSLKQINRTYRDNLSSQITVGLETEALHTINLKNLHVKELGYSKEIEEKFHALNQKTQDILKQKNQIEKYENELQARKYGYEQKGDDTQKTRIDVLMKLIADGDKRLKTLESEVTSIRKDLFQE